MSAAVIRILLVDDHTVLRDGLRALLETQPDLRVIAEAGDGQAALALAQRHRPDVLVLDIAMPGLNGLEVLRELHAADGPEMRVVFLTMHATAEHVYRAIQGGALGYVFKESLGSELVTAVRQAAAGHRYLCSRATAIALDDYARRSRTGDFENPLDRLSPHERQVLQLLAEGLSNSAIADRLSISAKTVETYRLRLMRKLEIKDLVGLVKFALRHGLTELE